MTDYELPHRAGSATFGMPLSRRRWVNGEKYRFSFQGQEGDDEWNGEGNMLAFKYRVHDAQLGRFLSIDPLAPDYPWNSPYAFSENRVIDGVELEGLERFSINSPAWVERLEKVQSMPVTTNAEIENKMRAFSHWATGLQAASAENPGLVTISNYINEKGGMNDAIVFSPVMSNREIIRFDRKLAEPESDESRHLEGTFDGADAGEIYLDYGAFNIGGCLSIAGRQHCGTFSLGWVKGDGFALTFTYGVGFGTESGPYVSLSGGKYVGDEKPEWGDVLGPSAQGAIGIGKVGASLSGNVSFDDEGYVEKVGDKFRIVTISVAPTSKGTSLSGQATITTRIAGGGNE